MTIPFAGIHLRTELDEDVRDLVSGLDCFHSAPMLGWISIFERDSGEGDLAALGSLAALLTEELRCTGIAFLGIDEAALFYLLLDRGEIIDEYGSDPEYFGATSPEEIAALAGREEKFRKLLIPGATPSDLRAVLDNPALTSMERGLQISRLLGIQNGAATYSDLNDEGRGGPPIIGREYFEHSWVDSAEADA